MYDVSAWGIDEHMINVHYYYYKSPVCASLFLHRLQLAIGHRQVCKGLERDQLSLVLVWGAAQPLLLIRSLLPLAASRACPALCLQKLMPTITDATGLSSLIAIGFKVSGFVYLSIESLCVCVHVCVCMCMCVCTCMHVTAVPRCLFS